MSEITAIPEFKAVSYTHLDVYKRQIKEFKFPPVTFVDFSRSKLMEETPVGGGDSSVKEIYGFTAVSYTHLDVYKRQPLNRFLTTLQACLKRCFLLLERLLKQCRTETGEELLRLL